MPWKIRPIIFRGLYLLNGQQVWRREGVRTVGLYHPLITDEIFVGRIAGSGGHFGCTGRDGVVYYIHCTLAQLLGSWPDLLALMILQITTSELIRSKPGLIPLCVDYRRHVNSAELTSRTVCLTNARRVCIGRPIVACRVYRHNSLQVSVGTFPNSHYITWYMKSRESPAEHKNWGCT